MLSLGSLRPFRRISPRAENQEVSPGCILIIAVPALFLVSCFFVWQDVKYALYSRTAEAQVERTFETVGVTTRRRGGRPKLQVEYLFRDETTDQERRESDLIPLHWPRPAGTVSIDYLPGLAGESRVSGNRSYVAMLLFAACGLAAMIILGILYREARIAARESERHEQARRREA